MKPHSLTTWAVVVAAGAGTRFGARKQFAPLRGARVVHHAVAAAGAACDGVVVVLPAGGPERPDRAGDTAEWDGPPVTAAVVGGETRSQSVRRGLDAVPADTEIVVVHDAVRPLAGAALFRAVIAAVEGGADGAVPALPVFDTLKRVEGHLVVETLDRDGLVAVQTPQAFRADLLRIAHAAGADATDDAALVEMVGGAVVVVDGDPRNLKITTAMDLELAVALLSGGDG